jgi:hypothetical protein
LHTFSQNFRVSGKIFDINDNSSLQFANVKVADTTYGTVTDKKGNYTVILNCGSWKIIASYLGYFTDTINIYLDSTNLQRNIYLKPSEIFTETIEVLGEDPAVEIIKKTIRYKIFFRNNLTQYDFNAYTKYIIRSNTGNVEDTNYKAEKGKYPIMSLMETESHVYYKKPDFYKDIVISRREAENEMVSGLALPIIVNFYDEVIDLNGIKIKCPLADDAFDFYDYKLIGVTSIDSQKVFKIEVKGSDFYPLFNGTIFISDSDFVLRKIDLTTNDVVNIPVIDKLNFKEKFTNYVSDAHQFWMPTDVQVYADGTFASFFKFSLEAYVIISNYNLNKKIPDEVFDNYVIKVLPDAKKDSSYWANNQLIKSTDEEKNAYEFFAEKNKNRNLKLEFGFPLIRYGKNLKFVSDFPYHFNRIEGSYLCANLDYKNPSNELNLNMYLGYGFSDKKSKYEIGYSGEFFKNKSLKIDLNIFKKLSPLSYLLSNTYQFFNTLSSLLDKKDYYDYYYSSGFNFKVAKHFTPQVGLSFRYNEEKQTSAKTNTSYSIRKHDELFGSNPEINEAFLRTLGIGIFLNLNKFMYTDYGEGKIESYSLTDYPEITANFEISPKKLASTYENKEFSFELSGANNISNLINLKYKIGGEYFIGEVPFQSLCSFNSSWAIWDKEFSFKTMGYREYLGDYIFYLNFENNFGNILWSKIPVFKKINLVGFLNAGKIGISKANYALSSNYKYLVLDKIYFETGFGLKDILNIIRTDFAWRLNNYSKGRNFNFSISFGM